MPNTKSAMRQLRRSLRRRAINRARKSRLRTFIKKLRKAIEARNLELAQQLLRPTIAEIDRAVKKGVIHENTGNRYKSKLMKKFNKLAAELQASQQTQAAQA